MGKALAKPSNQREGGNGQGAVEDEKVSDGRDKDDKACPRGRRVRRAAAGPPPGQARTQPSATGVYSSAGCACCGCRGRRGGVPPPPRGESGMGPRPLPRMPHRERRRGRRRPRGSKWQPGLWGAPRGHARGGVFLVWWRARDRPPHQATSRPAPDWPSLRGPHAGGIHLLNL